MTEIPTMACPNRCRSGLTGHPAPYHLCGRCSGTGRIPRPPLTAEEIAALPDGARVLWHCVTECDCGMEVTTLDENRKLFLSDAQNGSANLYVWLADDGGEG